MSSHPSMGVCRYSTLCTRACMYACTKRSRELMHACTYVRAHAQMDARTCAYMHASMRTPTHTHGWTHASMRAATQAFHGTMSFTDAPFLVADDGALVKLRLCEIYDDVNLRPKCKTNKCRHTPPYTVPIHMCMHMHMHTSIAQKTKIEI